MRCCWPRRAQRNICVRPDGSRFTAPKRVSSRSRPSSTWPPSSDCRCNPLIRPGQWRSNRLSIRYSGTGCSGRRRAYAARFAGLGGVFLAGGARTLHRSGGNWRVETDQGALDASQCVIALGPWASDLFRQLGITLPLAVKRGYHRHFRAQGNAGLVRPVLDADVGYLITPMEQGLRITTGAEFAARDAQPSPVQFDRIMPRARELFPLGERVDDKT